MECLEYNRVSMISLFRIEIPAFPGNLWEKLRLSGRGCRQNVKQTSHFSWNLCKKVRLLRELQTKCWQIQRRKRKKKMGKLARENTTLRLSPEEITTGYSVTSAEVAVTGTQMHSRHHVSWSRVPWVGACACTRLDRRNSGTRAVCRTRTSGECRARSRACSDGHTCRRTSSRHPSLEHRDMCEILGTLPSSRVIFFIVSKFP